MEIALLFFLILVNGAFAMSEIALVASRKGRLQKLADEGDHGAARALELNQEPTRFLSTVQIGITSIAILNGIVGEAAFAEPVAKWLQAQGVKPQYTGWMSIGLVVLTITYFSIVLGELVPKRIGQMNPEAIARVVATPLRWLSILAKPFVKLLSASTHLIIRMLGVTEREDANQVEEDIHALLVEGSESGAIEDTEHELVRNVFRLDDRLLGSLMVPRAHIVLLDANLSWKENAKRIEDSDHSRYPVVRRDLHDILGIVTARHLLVDTLKGRTPDLTKSLQRRCSSRQPHGHGAPRQLPRLECISPSSWTNTAKCWAWSPSPISSRRSPVNSSRAAPRTRGPCSAATARGCSMV
jgi:putative hemolysin